MSKVLGIVTSHSKHTRALTFENLCQLTKNLQREVGAGGAERAEGAEGARGGREEKEGNGEGDVTSLKDDKTKSSKKMKDKKASKDKTSKTKRKRVVKKNHK